MLRLTVEVPMSEENKQLVHRWFDEVWNQKNESAIDRMFDPEGRLRGQKRRWHGAVRNAG